MTVTTDSSAATTTALLGGLPEEQQRAAEDPSQPMRALKAANVIRTERAQLKITISVPDREASWNRCADVLDDPPRCVANMEIRDLLVCCRGLSKDRARYFCNLADASVDLSVRDLTRRQREVLATALRGWC